MTESIKQTDKVKKSLNIVQVYGFWCERSVTKSLNKSPEQASSLQWIKSYRYWCGQLWRCVCPVTLDRFGLGRVDMTAGAQRIERRALRSKFPQEHGVAWLSTRHINPNFWQYLYYGGACKTNI